MPSPFRNFEPVLIWSTKDGHLSERAQAWTRSVTDFIGAREGVIPSASLGATGGTTAFYRADGTFAVPNYPAGANPSASIGLTANNGSAATFMRSDASPALDQSITPTWTGAHTFSSSVTAQTLRATGAFACNGAALQTSAAVNTAVAGSAGATYTGTEQGIINAQTALLNQIRAALIANGIAV